MRWTGDETYDGQLVVECERCLGTGGVCYGMGEANTCGACSGSGEDYFDPLPFLRVLGMAAALTLAWEYGHVHLRGDRYVDWSPNIDGRAVDWSGR